MGYVKDKIKELIKEAGSRKKARSVAERWFDESSKSRTLNEVQQTRNRFEPGKIYVFDYKPVTENLPWFDANPVVLAIEHKGENDLGINLNLLPVNFKEQLLEDLYNRMEGQIKNATSGKRSENANRQAPLRITYDGIKAYLKKDGYDFAIRQYIPNLKTKQAVVSYENWAKIALCDFVDLEGITLNEMKKRFKQHLKK